MNSSHTPPQSAPLGVYLASVVVVFFCTLSAADSIGLVPYYIDGTLSESDPVTADSVMLANLPQLGESATPITEAPVNVIALPERLKIPAIDLDLPVQNPATRDTKTLDLIIQKGPARYVDSAKLGESGNMIIYAHSSVYPVLKNQMWKAFNRIHELHVGDPITLESGGKQYVYTVSAVSQVDTKDTIIDLSPTKGTKLTLVTCDIATGKTARFMVEADFVGIVGS